MPKAVSREPTQVRGFLQELGHPEAALSCRARAAPSRAPSHGAAGASFPTEELWDQGPNRRVCSPECKGEEAHRAPPASRSAAAPAQGGGCPAEQGHGTSGAQRTQPGYAVVLELP